MGLRWCSSLTCSWRDVLSGSAAALVESDPQLLSFASSLAELEELVRAHSQALQAEEQALREAREQILPQLRDANATLLRQQQHIIDAGIGIEHHTAAPATQRQPLANKTNTHNTT